MGAVTAKVFTVRIQSGSLSLNRGLAPFVDAKRSAVQSTDSGFGDVDYPSTLPKDGVLCAVILPILALFIFRTVVLARGRRAVCRQGRLRRHLPSY